MSSRSLFIVMSRLSLWITLILGVGSIFLVERLIPAMGSILKHNSQSVHATTVMFEAVSLQSLSITSMSHEESFWDAFAVAQENIGFEGEKELLDNINAIASRFWAGEHQLKAKLVEAVSRLSVANLNEMNERENKVRRLGLSGTWALAFLLILLIAFHYYVRNKILTTILDPLAEITSTLNGYYSGNVLRRYYAPQAPADLKEAGRRLNDLIDQTSRRS